MPMSASHVKAIYSTGGAFAALKEDGTVAAWGDSGWGATVPLDLNGVKVIYSNSAVFVAVKEDGTVVAWGKASRGGSVPQG